MEGGKRAGVNGMEVCSFCRGSQPGMRPSTVRVSCGAGGWCTLSEESAATAAVTPASSLHNACQRVHNSCTSLPAICSPVLLRQHAAAPAAGSRHHATGAARNKSLRHTEAGVQSIAPAAESCRSRSSPQQVTQDVPTQEECSPTCGRITPSSHSKGAP